MKKITMRLHKIHDLDLISLYKNPEYSLEDILITALRAFIHNEPVYFYVPSLYPMNLSVIPNSIMLHLSLDEEKDEDIIEFLSHVKEGYRNSFLKNMVRGCMVGSNIYPYIDTSSVNIKTISNYVKKETEEYDKVLISPNKKRRGRRPAIVLNKDEEQTYYNWLHIPMKKATKSIMVKSDINVYEEKKKVFDHVKSEQKAEMQSKEITDAAKNINTENIDLKNNENIKKFENKANDKSEYISSNKSENIYESKYVSSTINNNGIKDDILDKDFSKENQNIQKDENISVSDDLFSRFDSMLNL